MKSMKSQITHKILSFFNLYGILRIKNVDQGSKLENKMFQVIALLICQYDLKNTISFLLFKS